MEAWIYGAFSVIGLLIVPSQPWVWPSAQWWIGFADPGAPHAVMRDDLRCYYLLYAARYFQGFVTTLLEPKRKDFVEMLIHHGVTVAVCAISYWYGWNRIGVVVMVILDPADVPLHLAKLCKYTAEARVGKAAKRWTFAADRLFELFAVMFFAMRLVLYPYVCWSAHIEATAYFPKHAAEWSCVALLEILLALQVYWFGLILKVAIRMLATGSAEDVRSDSEEEEAKPQEEAKAPSSPLRERAARAVAALQHDELASQWKQLEEEGKKGR
jgi:ceramide synthetase